MLEQSSTAPRRSSPETLSRPGRESSSSVCGPGFGITAAVAFRDYLDALLRDVKGHEARTRRRVALFEKRVAKPSMSPVARDIVAKFGILSAGGSLATDAGVLPLDKKVIRRAIRRACRAALAELPDPKGELRVDLKLLIERLTSGAIIDVDSHSPKKLRLMSNAEGFKKSKENGAEFVIRAQVFETWFGMPVRTRRMLDWLDVEGLLDHSRAPTKRRSNEWAQKQVTWPDGSRPRSICLYLPGGIADLNRDG